MELSNLCNDYVKLTGVEPLGVFQHSLDISDLLAKTCSNRSEVDAKLKFWIDDCREKIFAYKKNQFNKLEYFYDSKI
jgi:hypothetical protein